MIRHGMPSLGIALALSAMRHMGASKVGPQSQTTNLPEPEPKPPETRQQRRARERAEQKGRRHD